MDQRHREDAHAREMFAKVERYLTSTLSPAAFCERGSQAYWAFRCGRKKYRNMMPLSLALRFFLYARATDMRKSFGGLMSSALARVPTSGDAYVVLNRGRERIIFSSIFA